MSNENIRKVIDRVATVSRRIAIQQNPVVLGTVLSRNPDGSLNVDDGKGGCARVAPKANVRIGQKIALGLEPAIGQQTSLQTQYITIEPPSVPCPTDDGGGEICPPGIDCTELVTIAAALEGEIFGVAWFDFPAPTFAEREDGVWQNRLNLAGDSLRGGPARGEVDVSNGRVYATTSRRTGAYSDEGDGQGPYRDQLTVGAHRAFLTFDTSDVSTAEVVAVTLRLVIYGNEATFVQDDFRDSIVLVPSDHNGDPDDTTNFDKVDETQILAEISIDEIASRGPDPPFNPIHGYTIDIPLDVALVEPLINRTGSTRFALLNKRDALPTSILPNIGIFSGLDVTESTPTPDDKANIAAGSYEITGTVYTPGTFFFAIPQTDGAGGVLGPGESYYAAVVYDSTGAATLIKGTKSTDPKKPATPPGGINISWVLCNQAGSTIILDSDISGFNSARPFAGANPIEIRTDISQIFTKEQSADVATSLLVTFTRRRSIL